VAGVISKLEKIISDIEASTPFIPRQRGTTNLSSAGGDEKLAILKNVKTL
jgi:hypothetical protein